MSKKSPAPKKPPAPKNTSATETPVNPADVLAAGAAQAAPQASAPEGPATQPDGNEGNLPLPGGSQGADLSLPELTAKNVAGAVIVTSEVEGFRRAGRAWSRTPITLSIDELSEAQIMALEQEPLLTVVYVAAGAEKVAG